MFKKFCRKIFSYLAISENLIFISHNMTVYDIKWPDMPICGHISICLDQALYNSYSPCIIFWLKVMFRIFARVQMIAELSPNKKVKSK